MFEPRNGSCLAYIKSTLLVAASENDSIIIQRKTALTRHYISLRPQLSNGVGMGVFMWIRNLRLNSKNKLEKS